MNQTVNEQIEDRFNADLFIHGNFPPKVVNVRHEEILRDVLVKLNLFNDEELFVFIGESEDALSSPTGDADNHIPADINLSIGNLELHKHKHVHISKTHRIEVSVFFNGVHKRKFSPAATIATVTTWAKTRFNIDPGTGSDLILSLRPDNEHPRPDQHLGELLPLGSDCLVFDLEREITPQG